MPTTTEDVIARKAYERFEARGRAHGDDLGDWFAAEAELRGVVTAIERPKGTAVATKKAPMKKTAAKPAPAKSAKKPAAKKK